MGQNNQQPCLVCSLVLANLRHTGRHAFKREDVRQVYWLQLMMSENADAPLLLKCRLFHPEPSPHQVLNSARHALSAARIKERRSGRVQICRDCWRIATSTSTKCLTRNV